MTDEHHESENTVEINSNELDALSLSTVILQGTIVGMFAYLTSYLLIVKAKLTKTYVEVLIILFFMLLAFGINWLICEEGYKSVHHHYGDNSVAHRVYDIVGILAVLPIYFIMRTLKSFKK